MFIKLGSYLLPESYRPPQSKRNTVGKGRLNTVSSPRMGTPPLFVQDNDEDDEDYTESLERN